jgi:hypothetical protein
MNSVFHRRAPQKAAALYRSESHRATLQRARFAGKTPMQITRNTRRDSVFTLFDPEKCRFTPGLSQFHSTFGFDFHKIANVSSALGV